MTVLIIDTFVPQSFGGGQFRQCSLCYYRAIAIVLLICFPFAILLYIGGYIFATLGIAEFIAQAAGGYAKVLIPNLFVNAQYELLRKFLNAQRIAKPTTIVAIITTSFIQYGVMHLSSISAMDPI